MMGPAMGNPIPITNCRHILHDESGEFLKTSMDVAEVHENKEMRAPFLEIPTQTLSPGCRCPSLFGVMSYNVCPGRGGASTLLGVGP